MYALCSRLSQSMDRSALRYERGGRSSPSSSSPASNLSQLKAAKMVDFYGLDKPTNEIAKGKARVFHGVFESKVNK